MFRTKTTARANVIHLIGWRMSKVLDDLDINIIEILQKNGRVSITELAEEVGASRPTITSRLRNLLKDDTVIVRGGLNLTKLDFKMACIGLEV